MTPSEYFRELKEGMYTMTSERLKNSYRVILELAEKYEKTGQTRSLERLRFLTSVLGEEEKLVSLGVTTFLYKEDIEEYIEKVASKVVKVQELRNYTREIPDEIVEVIEKTKDIFTEFYVVFTDYTGREEKKVAKERREKDPILFGCFKDSKFVADRFYFLGDWEDPMCDLTLDKLISEYKATKGENPAREISLPSTSGELLEMIGGYTPAPETSTSPSWIMTNEKKLGGGWFKKIRSLWTKE